MEISELLGKKIKSLRLEMRYSQEQLASKCNLHRTYIGQIERAEKNITLKNLQRIAEALEVTLVEIVSFEI